MAYTCDGIASRLAGTLFPFIPCQCLVLFFGDFAAPLTPATFVAYRLAPWCHAASVYYSIFTQRVRASNKFAGSSESSTPGSFRFVFHVPPSIRLFRLDLILTQDCILPLGTRVVLLRERFREKGGGMAVLSQPDQFQAKTTRLGRICWVVASNFWQNQVVLSVDVGEHLRRMR